MYFRLISRITSSGDLVSKLHGLWAMCFFVFWVCFILNERVLGGQWLYNNNGPLDKFHRQSSNGAEWVCKSQSCKCLNAEHQYNLVNKGWSFLLSASMSQDLDLITICTTSVSPGSYCCLNRGLSLPHFQDGGLQQEFGRFPFDMIRWYLAPKAEQTFIS